MFVTISRSDACLFFIRNKNKQVIDIKEENGDTQTTTATWINIMA